MRRVSLHTLGCKVNFSETSTIGKGFSSRGFEIVGDGEPCDVYVLNTCSVTERADRECRQLIRRVLRHSPDAYVIVIGCYAQLQPGAIQGIEGVDLVLGAREKFNLFDLAPVEFRKNGVSQQFVSCIDETIDFVPSSSSDVDGRTRAFLKIQDGCDYVCTFCTIPLARGRSRSMEFESVLAEAKRLADEGYKEIVLTGVNVGDYGRMSDRRFLDLIRALDNIDGVARFRLSSIEPNLLHKDIIEYILESRRFCDHFHIPLQSGSDAVLKSMRRRYQTAQYAAVVESIKLRHPEACIGADVMVGFPGETDEHFEETISFINNLPVDYLHVFTYSERLNTPADSFAGAVPPAVRKERSERLRSLGDEKRASFYAGQVGRVITVLFESESRPGFASGLTTNYVRVEVPSRVSLTNSIREVHCEYSLPTRCIGSLKGEREDQCIRQTDMFSNS